MSGIVKEKKIPMRQCLGCREMKPKAELVRVVRSPEGNVFLDRKGKTNGRGAYVCPDRNCLNTAIKRKAIERSLGCPVPEEVRDALLAELEVPL